MRFVSKLDLAVIATAVVCGTLWVESGHRVSIDAPMPAEIALRAPAAACPDSDSVPYTPTCLAFLGIGDAPIRRTQISTVETPARIGALPASNACPENDNKPYTPDCIRFLSGVFWRAN